MVLSTLRQAGVRGKRIHHMSVWHVSFVPKGDERIREADADYRTNHREREKHYQAIVTTNIHQNHTYS